MATRQGQINLTYTTDAAFRAFATELKAMLDLCFTQTSDTGQITDPAALVMPITNNLAGYWVYQMKDAQQANSPVYIKVTIGTGNQVGRPYIIIAVGDGSDGAGGLLGTPSLIATTSTISATTSSYLSDSYATQGEGYAGFLCVSQPSSVALRLMIERQRDAAGAIIPGGAVFVDLACLGSVYGVKNYSTGVVYNWGYANNAEATLPVGAGNSPAGQTYLYRPYFTCPEVSPRVGAVAYFAAEIAHNDVIETTLDGATVHYKAPSNYANCWPAGYNQTGATMALRWD